MTTQSPTMPTTDTIGFTIPFVRFTRMIVIALSLIVLGLFILLRTNVALTADVTTTLTLEPGDIRNVPHVIVPTQIFLQATALLFILTGTLVIMRYALERDIILRIGGSRGLLSVEKNPIEVSTDSPSYQTMRLLSRLGLAISAIIFIPMVLIAAAAGNSTNVTTMIAETLRLATPLAIGAMAGIWCERSGVTNIAIEGMMLFAACFGFTALFYLRNIVPDVYLAQFIAVSVAVLTGGVVSILHGWLSITFRTDQIVSGTVINILALGVTSFVRREYLLSTEAGLSKLQSVRIPILADLPLIGGPLFDNQPIFYMMFVVVIFTHIVLFYTRWGLRIRAVGEHPHAADTVGINVNRNRWIAVFTGGLVAGLAGAWFSLEATGRFNDGMTSGAGFIALAAVIFGKWYPFGAFGAAVLFGFAQALSTRLQILEVGFPVQFLQMVPYVVTIVVLAGFIGRASAPRAAGKPYVKE